MLFLLYPTITQHYFILCFVACLGTLQWTAARNNKPALSLLGQWGLGWFGWMAGLLLLVGGFSWFFSYTPGLFVPGLAGGELTIIFGAGGLCALLLTRLAGAFWEKLGRRSSGQQGVWSAN